MRISDANNRHSDKMKAVQGQQASHDFSKALYQRAHANPDASLSAMKQRDETLTSVDRTRQFADQNIAKSRQLAQKTRMDAHTMSFLTGREEADVRNIGHQIESYRIHEKEYANALHKHIIDLKYQELSDDEIEVEVQNFRDNYCHPLGSSYQAETSNQHRQDDQAGPSHQDSNDAAKENFLNKVKITNKYMNNFNSARGSTKNLETCNGSNHLYKQLGRIRDHQLGYHNHPYQDASEAYDEIKTAFEHGIYNDTVKKRCKKLGFSFAQE